MAATFLCVFLIFIAGCASAQTRDGGGKHRTATGRSEKICVGHTASAFTQHTHMQSPNPLSTLISQTHALKWQRRKSAAYAEQKSGVQSGQSRPEKTRRDRHREGSEECVCLCTVVCDVGTL